MTAIFFLLPFSLLLALLGLWGFRWTLKHGQYEDPQGDTARILYDHLDDGPPG